LRLVNIVLSPSNDWLDVLRRLADYQAHPSVRHILFVSTLKRAAQAYPLGDGGSEATTLESLEGGFEFVAIGAGIAMADIHEGVAFDEAGEPA
jgi:hypothetical protein